MRNRYHPVAYANAKRNAGSIVRPLSALDTNHALQGCQYVSAAPCSTTFAAPMVAPTAGAATTALTTNSDSARMLSRRGGPPNSQHRSVAAVSARAMLATSASRTHDSGQCGQCVTRCASEPARTYQIQ